MANNIQMRVTRYAPGDPAPTVAVYDVPLRAEGFGRSSTGCKTTSRITSTGACRIAGRAGWESAAAAG